MPATLEDYVAEARSTGRVANLPTQSHIAGKSIPTNSDKHTDAIEIFDPGRGEVFAQVCSAGEEEVEQAVAAARNAFRNSSRSSSRSSWGDSAPAERATILFRAANLLEQEAARFAVVECLDAGKTLAQAQGDIASCINTLRFYAGATDKVFGNTVPLGKDYIAFTMLEPVGVSLHITPWNYPLVTLLRGVAPALAAGCCVICKPAEQTPLSALMLADLLTRAGLPHGACNVVVGTGEGAGAMLARHAGIDHITFTGSVETGKLVLHAAAESVTHTTMELGGKSPVVVLADCDQAAALEGALYAIFENAGQICSAGSRLVIEKSIHEPFLERLVERAKSLSFGHGLRNPHIGAIATREQRDKIERYIKDAQNRGLVPCVGGNAATDPETRKGWFFEPTVLDKLDARDPIVQEEIFGPVLAVQVAEDAQEAFALADDTRYGLYAGIYTQNIDRALGLARDLQVGQVTINEYFAGGIALPFGGNRLSGFGREKGLEGLANYCSVKSVAAKIS